MPTRDAAPHVFLIGWTGCTQRHLQKYADIWASEGVTKTTLVLEHCAMGISERWRREKFDAVAADVLAQMASAGAPIIVHMFSNGGGHVWAALGRLDHRNAQNGAHGRPTSPTPCIPIGRTIEPRRTSTRHFGSELACKCHGGSLLDAACLGPGLGGAWLDDSGHPNAAHRKPKPPADFV